MCRIFTVYLFVSFGEFTKINSAITPYEKILFIFHHRSIKKKKIPIFGIYQWMDMGSSTIANYPGHHLSPIHQHQQHPRTYIRSEREMYRTRKLQVLAVCNSLLKTFFFSIKRTGKEILAILCCHSMSVCLTNVQLTIIQPIRS